MSRTPPSATTGDYKIWQVIAASAVGTIQITATLGLFVSLAVVLTLQCMTSPEDFKAWGWRVPFLISVPLIGLRVVARTGHIYAGLYYPVLVAGLTFVVGALLLRETHSVMIWKELETGRAGEWVSDLEGPA